MMKSLSIMCTVTLFLIVSSLAFGQTAEVVELTKRAENGDMDAQFELSGKYYNGDGVGQDRATARNLVRELAEKGHAKSQYQYGYFLTRGIGGSKEIMSGISWLETSANGGFAVASSQLAFIYQSGAIVSPDRKKARYWGLKAAEQGDMETQYAVGSSYSEGSNGYVKSSSDAFLWWKKAAEQGDMRAQHNIGEMYHNGDGITQDYEQALFWYAEAAKNGSSRSSSRIREVRELIKEKEISKSAIYYAKIYCTVPGYSQSTIHLLSCFDDGRVRIRRGNSSKDLDIVELSQAPMDGLIIDLPADFQIAITNGPNADNVASVIEIYDARTNELLYESSANGPWASHGIED